MDSYIQTFSKACTEVFKKLLGVEITPESPYFCEKNVVPVGDISGVIGLIGDTNGAVAISMKKEVAFKLTGILTGKTHTDLEDDDVRDAIGEIVNIIAGNSKQGLKNILQNIVISLPTIIRGGEHSISWSGNSKYTQIICIPFKLFDHDTFILSITIVKEPLS